MQRITKLLILVAVLAGAAWMWFTPHLTLRAMKDAAERGDGAALSQHVDFPAVRENLKTQINAMIMKEAGNGENPEMAAAGAMLVNALAGPMIDAMVTPEALTSMMQGKAPGNAGAITDADGQANSGPQPEISSGYEGFDRFVVNVSDPGGKTPVKFVLSRQNLVAWKLTAIELPLDQMGK